MIEPKQHLADAVAAASKRLHDAGIDQPRREAASLAAFSLSRDAVFLIAHPEHNLSTAEANAFESAVARREKREPFHYITGQKEFYGLDFAVKPGALIPRPETELLVEEAIKLLANRGAPAFLEIGVGSGCISISILVHSKHAAAEGVEVSEEAIKIATSNSARHSVVGRLQLRLGNIFAGTTRKFDLIVSNPPYIPDGDLPSLQAEVGEFEPHRALFGGPDGLSIVRGIVAGAPEFLHTNGILLLEIGYGQAASVKELFDAALWSDVRFVVDFQGIERVVVARLRG